MAKSASRAFVGAVEYSQLLGIERLHKRNRLTEAQIELVKEWVQSDAAKQAVQELLGVGESLSDVARLVRESA